MIESVISQVYGVLDKYSKDYNDAAVTDNLTRWKNNKSWLIELLRCHSNWNEDALAIVFDVTLSREIDSHTVVSYKNDLFNLIMELDITSEERNNFYTALNIAVNSYTKTLSSDDAVASIKQYSGVSVAVGQKTSRIINKICQRYGLDGHPEYNAHFARLADSLNPLKVKRKALLSVHPCDYLEMSNRINSWNSCHCLSDGVLNRSVTHAQFGRNIQRGIVPGCNSF